MLMIKIIEGNTPFINNCVLKQKLIEKHGTRKTKNVGKNCNNNNLNQEK